MKRTVSACLAISLMMPIFGAAPALARKSGTTREQCSSAIAREARNRFGGRDFGLVSNDIREISRDENRMTGTARLDRRSFRYECTYNISTGRTYGVSLRPDGGGPGGPGGGNGGGWGGGHGGGNGGGNGGGWGGGDRRLPPGSWARSCRGGDLRGSMLWAQCRTPKGKWTDSRIDVRGCPTGGVGNRNGQLVCE